MPWPCQITKAQTCSVTPETVCSACSRFAASRWSRRPARCKLGAANGQQQCACSQERQHRCRPSLNSSSQPWAAHVHYRCQGRFCGAQRAFPSACTNKPSPAVKQAGSQLHSGLTDISNRRNLGCTHHVPQHRSQASPAQHHGRPAEGGQHPGEHRRARHTAATLPGAALRPWTTRLHLGLPCCCRTRGRDSTTPAPPAGLVPADRGRPGCRRGRRAL